MKQFCTLTMTTMSLAALFALSFPAGGAFGQAAKELLGSWTLISVTVNQGGDKIEPFGPNPKGTMTFDGNGRFSIVVVRSDLPKFSSNNREMGTPDENKAVVQGSIAYFGTYSVSEEDREFIVHVEGSTFSNWVGTDQKRVFAITGDELKYTNSNRSGGAGTALVVWKRAK
jgi:Lipocalin-like domain